MANEQSVDSRTYRGIFRNGLVRLLEDAPWDEGTPVEVSLAVAPSVDFINPMCQVIVAGF